MTAPATVTIRVTREVDFDALLSRSLRTFFSDVMLVAHADVAQAGRTPIDTGLLRSSLAPGGAGAAVTRVDDHDPPTFAQVGTNVEYAGYLDAGEKYHYRSGPSQGQPTKGWLSDTPDRVSGDVNKLVGDMAADIERGWGR